jgi:hypothetical protein
MPDFSVTINYVPSEWSKAPLTASVFAGSLPTTKGTEFANMVGDGISRVWRLTLLTAIPAATVGATQSHYDSNVGGLGTTSNSSFYFEGRIESILITPSLTDATQATLAFSIQSDFYGAYTVGP